MAFERRYTDAQKNAVLSAQMDYGYTSRQAVAAALNGELPGKGRLLEPFEMTHSTAAHLKTAENRRRKLVAQVSTDPGDVVRNALGNMVRVLDERTRTLSRARGKDRATAADVREWARAAQDVLKLARELDGHVKAKQPAQPERDPDETADFLGRLAQAG